VEFLHWQLLPLAAGALIPWLIYLWRRRQRQSIAWGAMQFVLAAVAERGSTAVRIEWLLLVVRSLWILALALAAAGPVLRGKTSAVVAAAPTPARGWILVLDMTLSMNYREQGTTLAVQAQQQARHIVERAASHDQFLVVSLERRPRAVVDEPTSNRTRVAAAIDALVPTQAAGDVAATIDLVEALVGRAARQSDVKQWHVVWLSDFQSVVWQTVLDTGAAQDALAKLSAATAQQFLAVGSPARPNEAIVGIHPATALATVGQEIPVAVHVRGYQLGGDRQSSIELVVDEQVVERRTIRVTDGRERVEVFSYRPSRSGWHDLSARLGPDALELDNRRWTVLDVRPQLEVLCIAGRPGEADPIVAALPTEPDNELMHAATTVISPAALERTALDRFDCVISANVPRYSTEDWRRLARFVEAGGGLLVLLGNAVDLAGYAPPRETNGAGAGGVGGLLPAELVELAPWGDYQFDPLDYAHPIVAPFRDFRQGAGLRDTPIWRYVRLQPRPTSETVLGLDSGGAALVVGRAGEGRVALLATSSSSGDQRPWTALDAWWSFVPLVNETIGWLVAGHDAREWLVGDVAEGVSPSTMFAAALTAVGPDGSSRAVPTRIADGTSRWRLGPLDRAGIYRVQWRDPSGRSLHRTANVDSIESDTRSIDAARFAAVAGPPPDEPAANAAPSGDHQPLYSPLLLVVLILMLAEVGLGRWLARL
jgi:hypothetical protein